MASSFGTITIRALRDRGGTRPEWERPSGIVRDRYAGIGQDSVQILPGGDEFIGLTLEADSAEYASLRAAIGTIATLTLAGVNEGPCLLEDLGRARRSPEGRVEVQARFTRPVS